MKRAKKLGMTRMAFAASAAHHGTPFTSATDFSVERLGPVLRNEMRYALQCRHDDRGARLPRATFVAAVNALVRAEVTSILDRSAAEWNDSDEVRGTRAFLRYVRNVVELAMRPTDPLQRDLWVASDFLTVRGRTTERIHWAHISQLWLRDPARRWAERRIEMGRRWKTICMGVTALRHFSAYLDSEWPDVRTMGAIERRTLTNFSLWLRRDGAPPQSISDHVSSLRLFIDDYRAENGWGGPALRAETFLRDGDVGAPPERLPRPVKESVMQQIEDPKNLAMLPLHLVTLLMIGIHTGLRISSVMSLPFDCLREDRNGHHTLLWHNVKKGRDRAFPLDTEEVVRLIEKQQSEVLARWKAPAFLFPAPYANPDGRWTMSRTTVARAITEWIADCGIIDPATGEPAKITFHQFRHTFASRLRENGASESLIADLLDHESTRTTRGYAQLSDGARRKQFEEHNHYNNRGELLDPVEDEVLAEATWLRQELNRMHLTLPNGYCGMPLQQTCDARNACLDCDTYFITTPAFLDVHRQQLDETRRLIATGTSNGQLRMVERNRQTEEKLVRIIGALEADHETGAQ